MRIISKKTLQDFWINYQDSEVSIRAWYYETKNSIWNNPSDIKQKYRNASFIANNRVIFNIHGNKYRLIVAIDYNRKIVYIRFIGTHKEYDLINPNEV